MLCSRGVRAKWDAMCGVQHPVTLREDVRSPNDDMTTPAIHLMAPDLQRAASLGKYLVAYFEDISSEHDVPSLFHIAAKYVQILQIFGNTLLIAGVICGVITVS